MAEILIIDDDPMLCDILSFHVKDAGHEPVCAFSLKEGMEKALAGSFDVVFLDVRLPDGNGLEAIPTIKMVKSLPEIIIMTGMGDPDGAELAIKSGAWDYIEKPSSINMMLLPLVRALQYREATMNINPLVAIKKSGIIGNSTKMMTCLTQVAQAANSNVNVLITGETGTGKELMAWAIHRNSTRFERNFVVVDCAALTDTLVESMLFGCEKGAYTGADRAREGLIKEADGGTLFLDEVGELPLSIQRSFLRVLQERRFRPLGGKQEVQSDFRLVAATNRNLDQMILRGQFRSDLLHRLRAFVIDLPSLRSRPEDIPALAICRLTQLCERHGMSAKGLSPEFLEALTRYEWPGNVRELFNTLERVLAVVHEESTLFPKHLPDRIRIEIAKASIGKEATNKEVPAKASIDEESRDRAVTPTGSDEVLPRLQDLRESMIEKLEKEYLHKLIAHTGNQIKESCRISGLSRSRLYGLLKKYGLTDPS